MYAFAPVVAGDWKQHEIWDGTYTFDDLLDWYELFALKKENERRIKQYRESFKE